MNFKLFYEQQIKIIYFDMDDVLANFTKMFYTHYPEYKTISTYDIEKQKFWSMVKQIDGFWENLEPMPALYVLHKLHDLGWEVQILSAPSDNDKRSIPGKLKWIKKHIKFPIKYNFADKKEKKNFAQNNYILIDDMKQTIIEWNNKGGIGIHYKNYNDLKSQLQKILDVNL